MTKTEKTQLIESLSAKLRDSEYFYVTDSSALSVEQVNKLRRQFFESGIEMKVVKNTLMRKALDSLPEEKNFAGLHEALKGPTSILFTEVANVPAKILKEFRKTHEKPILKAAYIDSSIYFGDDQIATLAELKSKEDLLGEVIGLLQSPAKNVLSALQSGAQTIAGLVKALEERESGN